MFKDVRLLYSEFRIPYRIGFYVRKNIDFEIYMMRFSMGGLACVHAVGGFHKQVKGFSAGKCL